MSQFLQASEVHDGTTHKSFTFLCQSSVKNTNDTITENQLEILNLFKSNLLVIKSKVDTCLNKLIGHELQLKNSKNKPCENESSTVIERATEKVPYCPNNIVIHGLKKLRGVSKTDAAKIVNSFFETALQVNVHVENVQVLKRSTHVVAVVTLSSKSDRRNIFKNCHKLKDFPEKVSITNDVPVEERERRKQSLSSKEASPGPEEMPGAKLENCIVVQTDDFEETRFKDDSAKKIEDNLWFWESQEINERISRISKIGEKYGFADDDMKRLSYLIGTQNSERLEECSCICGKFMQLNWKRLPEKFGRPLPNKFVKKLKLEMNAVIKAWNDGQDVLDGKCYCQQILPLTIK